MFTLIKYIAIMALVIGLAGCESTPYVVVQPENFSAVQTKFDTFLFGTFYTDSGQDVYLNFNGDAFHMLLSRSLYYIPTPGKAEFFIFPVSNKVYSIRNIEFYTDPDRVMGDAFNNYYNNLRSGSRSMVTVGSNVLYPNRDFPYPVSIKVEKGFINYIGRIIMTNDDLLVENHFDEDKALLLDTFQKDPNAAAALSHSAFTNLKQ